MVEHLVYTEEAQVRFLAGLLIENGIDTNLCFGFSCSVAYCSYSYGFHEEEQEG